MASISTPAHGQPGHGPDHHVVHVDRAVPRGGPGYVPHEHPVVASHFRSLEDQNDAGKLGMWLFLTTEVLLFAGFFCAYAVFRMLYPHEFAGASHHYLNWKIGAANTAVLLLSSYTVAMAIRSAQLNQQFWIKINLVITILCGLFFLVVKILYEYLPKIDKGELPAGFYKYNAGVYDQEPLFLSIYWISTATHGFHVLVGVVLLSWLLWRSTKQHFGPKTYLALENVGLYWHLVDLIWIFLFPLLYLI